MNRSSRIPVLKRALTALRQGESNPQSRIRILQQDVFPALILIMERELRYCLIEEQDRYKDTLPAAIERAVKAVDEDKT